MTPVPRWPSSRRAQVGQHRGRDGELAHPDAVAGEHVAVRLDHDREVLAEVGEGVVAARVDVQSGSAGDVAERAESACLRRGRGRRCR